MTALLNQNTVAAIEQASGGTTHAAFQAIAIGLFLLLLALLWLLEPGPGQAAENSDRVRRSYGVAIVPLGMVFAFVVATAVLQLVTRGSPA